MSKQILTLLMGFSCLSVNAQIVRIATSPSAIASQVPGYNEVSAVTTKSYQYTPSPAYTPPTPVDDDSTTEDSKIYPYADNIPVNIGISDGNITSTSVGKVWTLRISISNALNIGFAFNQFALSSSAEMFIFNETRTVLDSGIKYSHFSNPSQVAIFPIKGNSAIIYIVEKNNYGSLLSSISIQNLEAGYQEIDDVGDVSNTGSATLRTTSVNCNPHMLCQSHRMQSARSVARFASNGFQGTGTLINSEGNNGRAFFLTAFHVLDVNRNFLNEPAGNGILDPDEIAALASARFQFQFWRTSCNGNTNNNGIQFTGAVLRAACTRR